MTGRLWERGPDGEVRRAAPTQSLDAAPGPPVPTACVRRALRLGFRDAYDYLGVGVLASILYALIAGAGFFGGQALGAFLFGRLPGLLPGVFVGAAALGGLALVGGPAAAGIFRFARKAAAREEPDVFDLAWGFGSLFANSVGLAALQGYGTALLAGNAFFYFTRGHVGLLVVAALFAYGTALWGVMLMYQWPLLLQEPTAGVLKAVRKSALLVLANPGYCAGMALAALLMSLALGATVAGVVLVWAGSMAMLTTQATRELLRKYGVLGPDPTLDPISDEVAP